MFEKNLYLFEKVFGSIIFSLYSTNLNCWTLNRVSLFSPIKSNRKGLNNGYYVQKRNNSLTNNIYSFETQYPRKRKKQMIGIIIKKLLATSGHVTGAFSIAKRIKVFILFHNPRFQIMCDDHKKNKNN